MSAGASGNAPLNIAQTLLGAIMGWEPRLGAFYLSKGPGAYLFETRTTPTKKVEVDVKYPAYGNMTPPAVRGAESPQRKIAGPIQRRFVTCVQYREKVRIDEEELVSIRRPGSLTELLAPAERIAEIGSVLREGVQTRIEWLYWQSMRGAFTINENGQVYDYPFYIPAYLDVTLSTPWTDLVNANPINDINEMTEAVQRFNYNWARILVNKATMNQALQIEQFRDYLASTLHGYSRNQMAGFPDGPAQGMNPAVINDVVGRFLTQHPVLEEWNGAYNLTIPTVAAGTAGGQTLSLEHTVHVEIGDVITLIDKDTEKTQSLEIDAVDPINDQIHVTEGMEFNTAPRSLVSIRKTYILDGEAFLLPDDNRPIGAGYIAPSVYAPGTLTRPVSAVFSQVNDHSADTDPPFMDLIVGVDFAPAVWKTNSRGHWTLY